MGGNERNMGERGKKYERVGKSLQVRARLNTISCYFKGKSYSRGIGDALRSSKTKVGSYHLEKKTLKHRMSAISHSFLSRAFWTEMQGMWEKYREGMKK